MHCDCTEYSSSLDADKGIVTIRRSVTWDLRTWVPKLKEYTKTKRVRHLPIPQPLLPVIEALRLQKKSDLVFQRDDGTPMNRQTIAPVYNRALGRLKFDHVSGTHFIKRTAAMLANEARRPITMCGPQNSWDTRQSKSQNGMWEPLDFL